MGVRFIWSSAVRFFTATTSQVTDVVSEYMLSVTRTLPVRTVVRTIDMGLKVRFHSVGSRTCKNVNRTVGIGCWPIYARQSWKTTQHLY